MKNELRDKIYLGDTRNYLASIPDECVDLVVSSPPYNLGKEYEAKVALDKYLAEQTDVLRQCVRVMKPTASIFWQVGAFSDRGQIIPLDIRFFPILESLGLKPRNRIIWVRQHGLHASRKFTCRHETILWFTKSDNYPFNVDPIRVPQKYPNKKHYRGDKKGEYSCNPDGKNPVDIWAFRNVKHNHEEQTIHPCQFPEDLVARIVLATTNPGDTVLDPYMGAGTIAIVSRDHRRHFLGAELEPRYHDVALRRLAGLPDRSGVFPNLKTLRAYVERTGQPIDQFRFDVQVSDKATTSQEARIFPEQHHLDELAQRLEFEETSFAARLRNLPPPEDYFQGGQVKARTRAGRRSDISTGDLFERTK